MKEWYLTEKQFTAVQMREEGMTHRQIARALGISISAVFQRIQRARESKETYEKE